MKCKSYKSYYSDFYDDYLFLKSLGMSEEYINEFFFSVAYESIRNDINFNKHNRPMFSQDEERNRLLDSGIFTYRLASQTEEEEKEQMGWSSIKVSVTVLSTEDNTDIYIENVEITEQLADKELQDAVHSLSDRQQKILELMVDGWPQKKIAAHLGISGAAVCKNVETIRKRLGPYYRKNHWLKVNN